MDDVAGQTVALNGDEQQQYEDQIQLHFSSDERGHEQYDNLDNSAVNDIQHSVDENSRDSSAGKLFVGGIAWETTEESFSNYFSNYGQIMDSVIMMDKITGRPRGFGFVTFVDPAVADKVLEEEHVIDGRPVEVKRTVPREDKRMQVKGVVRTKKIFVGGIPLSLTEDDLREYFSSYGNVLEQQIMLDHTTGRSRGFGFVTFDTEDAVEKIFSDGQLHELGGKQVEIKKAEPKRPGSDYGSDSRMRHGGSNLRSYGGGGGGPGRAGSYGGGYGGKMGRGYGGQGNYGSYDDYGGYSSYGGGNYGGGASSFYPGYGAGYGYGFGFGGPMYGSGYGGNSYGTPSSYGAAAGYGGKVYGSGGGAYGGRGYSGSAGGGSGYEGGKGYGSGSGGGYDGGRGYGSGSGGGGSGSGSGRYHPYRK